MTRQALLDSHARIKPYIHRTPVMSSTAINKMAGAEIYFKCENFQRMGAFKMRGATNAILQLSPEERARGVVTHSSGNMAQAVSLGARSQGVPAFIVMPENAPAVKKAAVRGYGGQITESKSTIEAREAATEILMEKHQASFIHPSDDMAVILGQGTAAMELLEEQPELEAIVVPVGGGGLLAGTALAAHFFGKDCLAYAGEPYGADDAYRSLEAGKILKNESVNTVADGLRTHLGEVNFPIIQKYVKAIIRVEEEEIISAMRLIWERMKIIIEPSCAVPLAAVLRARDKYEGKQVGIILSGGNVDLDNLPF